MPQLNHRGTVAYSAIGQASHRKNGTFLDAARARRRRAGGAGYDPGFAQVAITGIPGLIVALTVTFFT